MECAAGAVRATFALGIAVMADERRQICEIVH